MNYFDNLHLWRRALDDFVRFDARQLSIGIDNHFRHAIKRIGLVIAAWTQVGDDAIDIALTQRRFDAVKTTDIQDISCADAISGQARHVGLYKVCVVCDGGRTPGDAAASSLQ